MTFALHCLPGAFCDLDLSFPSHIRTCFEDLFHLCTVAAPKIRHTDVAAKKKKKSKCCIDEAKEKDNVNFARIFTWNAAPVSEC